MIKIQRELYQIILKEINKNYLKFYNEDFFKNSKSI